MRAALLAFLLALTLVSPAAADRFALKYRGTALGVFDVGEMTVDADLSSDSYEIAMTLRSAGLLSLFEQTSLSGASTGLIQNGAVRWRSYDLDHHYSRKHRLIAMRTSDDGGVQQTITPNFRLWGNPPASEDQRRRSRDPLSTIMAMAVDVNLTHRCSGVYPTFDGRFHYLLELRGGQLGRYNDGGYEGPVMKCEIAYIAVSGFENSDRGRRRVPHGEVWFALVPDSAFGPPVRIQTPFSAGGATVRLTEFRRAQVGIDVSVPAAPSTAP